MYYAYGSDVFYNKMLDAYGEGIEKSLTELNSIVRVWMESDNITQAKGADQYHENCLGPLISHIAEHGGMHDSLSDPLTMLLLVNCLTNWVFHGVSYDLNHGESMPNATPELNDAAECLSNFKSQIGDLVTVMSRVQLLYRDP